MGERKYESVIADYEWVVGMRHEVRFASQWILNEVRMKERTGEMGEPWGCLLGGHRAPT